MTDNKNNIINKKTNRRDFMSLVATSSAIFGGACALWPMLDSMNPASDILASSSTEVDISNIKLGSSRTVQWRGKPVFIKHRTSSDIEKAVKADLSLLRDPEKDSERVKRKDWLVVMGICTHLGCIPNIHKDKGWLCGCHGSYYDTSGRVVSGPAPRNLPVPPYEFLSEKIIRIG